jgi:hypothetical protein
MVNDLDGDGKRELFVGGRIDPGKQWESILRAFRFSRGEIRPVGSWREPSETKIRLRSLSIIPDKAGFIGAGRVQLGKTKKSGWRAYIRQFDFVDGKIQSLGDAQFIEHGFDTRIRSARWGNGGILYCAGFVNDKDEKSKGLILLFN